MKKTTTTPKLTAAEEREKLEKAGMIYLQFMQVDADTIRVMPKNLIAALRFMNKADDTIIFPTMGIAVPASYLRKFAALMGEDCATLKVDRATMILTLEYKPTMDSRSRTQIKGIDAREYDGEYPPAGLAIRISDTAVPEPAVVDAWIAKAVSKDDARPQMMRTYGNIAADAYRIHYDRRLAGETPPYDAASILHDASRAENIALVDVAALITTMKAIKKINKKTAAFSVNGRMDVSTTVDDSTFAQVVTAGYDHRGENVRFAIDPAFVLDALSGMAGDVIIGISEPRENGGRTIYISDGARESVIMTKLEA